MSSCSSVLWFLPSLGSWPFCFISWDRLRGNSILKAVKSSMHLFIHQPPLNPFSGTWEGGGGERELELLPEVIGGTMWSTLDRWPVHHSATHTSIHTCSPFTVIGLACREHENMSWTQGLLLGESTNHRSTMWPKVLAACQCVSVTNTHCSLSFCLCHQGLRRKTNMLSVFTQSRRHWGHVLSVWCCYKTLELVTESQIHGRQFLWLLGSNGPLRGICHSIILNVSLNLSFIFTKKKNSKYWTWTVWFSCVPNKNQYFIN